MASPLDKHEATHCIEVKEMEDELGRFSDNRYRYAPTIFRVPSGIRHVKDAFEPQVISLGPYHHASTALKGMQDHKWWYLSKFISRNPSKVLSDYFEAIKASIDRARKCYSEEIEMDDDKFVRMLLLDGCFIVELLLMFWDGGPSSSHGASQEKRFDKIVDTNCMTFFLIKDMFKLENQVPFFILKILYQLLEPEEEPSITDILFNFIARFTDVADVDMMQIPSPDEEIHHLVHFYHLCFFTGRGKRSVENGTDTSTIPTAKELREAGVRFNKKDGADLDMMEIPSPDEEIHHLLHFYHLCFFTGRGKRSVENVTDTSTIPTAKELREAGVRFKKKEKGRYLEATFSNANGVIEMTPVFIDDNFANMFHNLLAFEQCCPAAGAYVTGYSVFLDCIVDTATDVLLLRQAGVVTSGLGSDKDLANQVNRLCYNLTYGADPEPFGILFRDVNEYCRSRCPRWRATLVHDYFNNPWAIISFIGAIMLLGLTGMQTAYTMLSYNRSP